MKKYARNDEGSFCGYWNDSDLQFYLHANKSELYKNEHMHYHEDYNEYYLITEGELTLIVDGKEIVVKKNEVVMVEPKEVHRVQRFGPKGCIYAVVKSKSYKNSKITVPE